MTMTMGGRIKALRTSKKMSQDELGSLIQTTRQTIFKYENDIITNIPPEKIEKIAAIFHVSPAYLAGWGETPDDEKEALEFQNSPQWRVIKSVEGADMAIVFQGDSMEPKIHSGDVVAIRRQDSVVNGRMAAVRLNGELTVRMVWFHQDYVEFRAVNPDFPSVIKRANDLDDVVIEGLVIGSWHPF